MKLYRSYHHAYRTVGEMTADELLHELRRGGHYGEDRAVYQITLFIRMGGNPNDHDYARLSFLTQALRRRGIPVGSSRSKGLWLDEEQTQRRLRLWRPSDGNH